MLNEDKAPFYKWFEGGTLNVSYQCLDRHMKTRRNKAALIFEGEMGIMKFILIEDYCMKLARRPICLKNSSKKRR